jgi:hypothetical protein
MQALPGFPLLAGKVIPSDFDQWRLIRTTGLSSLHRGDRLRSAVGKARGLASTSDSRVSWRLIESSLKAAVSSLGLPGANENNDA